MEKIWDELYVAAKQVLRPRRISDRMEARRGGCRR